MTARRHASAGTTSPTTGRGGDQVPALQARDLSLGYRPDRLVVRDLDLDLPVGRVTAVIGGNGCGKSTLLRSLARLLAPRTGSVLLGGRSVHSLPSRQVARQLGLLPQGPNTPEGLTVRDLVRRGRLPHTSIWRQWGADDEAALQDALADTDLLDLVDHAVDALSGGRRQRAWLALVVAQQTPILLLDEPTTYLDMAHQLDVLDLVRRLNREGGRTVVMVLHDINQACLYADHIVAMRDGTVVARGDPADVITTALVRAVFDVDCHILAHPDSGLPHVIPVRRV